MSSLLPLSEPDETPNYHRRAFLHPANLAFLGAIALSAVLLAGTGGWQTLVLLFGAAAELLYLGLVPRSTRFRRMIRSEQEEARWKPLTRSERIQELSTPSQKRVLQLERLQHAIQTNYRKVNDAAQGLLESHLEKLDDLMSAHVQMLYLQERYRAYTSETAREEVARSKTKLEGQIAEASPRVRAIRKRQLSILDKRLERYDAAEEHLEILEAQIDAIEEVVRYVHDESLTLTDPQEITLQLDSLVSEVEETRESVRELEDLFRGQSSAPVLEEVEEEIDEEAASQPSPESPNRRP